MAGKRRTWLATFDGASARLYAVDRATKRCAQLPLGVWTGPHKPSFEDQPDTVRQSVGEARGMGEPRVNAERELEADFIARLAEELLSRADDYDELIVAAAPRALGAFREVAPGALKTRVNAELAHDYVHTPAADLYARIETVL